jgi:DNA polymerase I-like protein with 3'-5' exonuclease and polymerase domains
MHNAKFDLSWMIEHCPSPNGQIYARNIQDTMLKSQLVHDYRTKSGAAKAGRPQHWAPNDLQSVLQEQLGVEISKSIDHDTTDWTGPWSEEMLDYMLEDIEYLAPLNQALDKKLQQQGQERASWIEQQAVFATAWMGVNGIKPDIQAWGCRLAQPVWHPNKDGERPHSGTCVGAIADWQEQHHNALMDLLVLWPGVDNFGSPKQLVESSARVLGGRLVNTKKATLKQMSAGFPAVAKLLEQRHLATRLKNWGPHYLESYVCATCQRFHPGWNQIGTETSRPSCWKPNLLQIPRAAEFRALFVAEEGHQIVSLDYSAIEVLVAGVFAQEPRLIEACSTGDPHLATAMLISGDKDMVKSDPRRQAAKIANFGLLFGGGAQGLVTQALDLFDTVLTLGEATVMMDQYFRLYPGLKRTKGWAYDQLRSDDDRIEVNNAVGFRRYLEGLNRKPTSLLNTWIQSTAAYGMKSSFQYLNEAGLTPFVLGQVYDEILFEFPKEDADDFAQEAKRCMIRGMQDVIGQVPVSVSIDKGRSWS